MAVGLDVEIAAGQGQSLVCLQQKKKTINTADPKPLPKAFNSMLL